MTKDDRAKLIEDTVPLLWDCLEGPHCELNWEVATTVLEAFADKLTAPQPCNLCGEPVMPRSLCHACG
jgi:hypothetical protein